MQLVLHMIGSVITAAISEPNFANTSVITSKSFQGNMIMPDSADSAMPSVIGAVSTIPVWDFSRMGAAVLKNRLSDQPW